MTKIMHVGLPKCASTSLQVLFARARGATFIGKGAEQSPFERIRQNLYTRFVLRQAPRSGLYADVATRNIFRDALPSDRPFSDADIERMRGEIRQAATSLRGDPDRLLVSDEVLSGAGFIFFNIPRRRLDGIIAEWGRLWGDEALVVIVMRNQLSFLASYWKHLIRTGYPFTFGHFLSEQSDDPRGSATSWRSVTASLFYEDIRRRAAARGVRVAFVPFEDVVKSGAMLREVLRREGITIPEGLPHRRQTSTDASHIAKLEWNRSAPRKRGQMFDPADLVADEAAFREVVATQTLLDPSPHRERLIEAFRPGNRAFAEASGIDLGKLGYPV